MLFTIVASSVVTAVLVICVAFLTNYSDPYHKKVSAAGFVEKTADIGGISIHYAEGPDNGPALLLLHAQHMDWYSYSRVLPELSESFHVYALDYHGHGETAAPAEYMNANRIGGDLAAFIDTVIGEPVFVSGNSSGGLLAAWLGANALDLVKAAVLEDPPLFSSAYPRVKETIAYRSFTHCHTFLQFEDSDDFSFVYYWLEQSSAFIQRYAGGNYAPFLMRTAWMYKNSNPDKAIELFFLPVPMRLMVRGMSEYDPAFGDAFYDGSWHRDFDHGETLERILCPVLLIQAEYEVREDGILDGAMDQGDAERALALIPHAQYVKTDAGHVTHLDQPEAFTQRITEFFLGSETSIGGERLPSE